MTRLLVSAVLVLAHVFLALPSYVDAAASGGVIIRTASDSSDAKLAVSAASPTITSIQPSPPMYQPTRQWLFVNGSGFESHSLVVLTDPDGTPWTVNPDRTRFAGIGQIQVWVGLFKAGNWSAKVTNPGGPDSESFSFYVAPHVEGLDTQLVALINLYAPTYWKEEWKLSLSQFKAWIALISLREAGIGRYGAHSQYGPNNSTPDDPIDGDRFNHKDIPDLFSFSTGIGAFQLDNGGTGNGANEDWTHTSSLEKMNPETSLLSVLRWHRDRFAGEKTLNDLSTYSKWVAVQPGNQAQFESTWQQITGQTWTSGNTIEKDVGFNPPTVSDPFNNVFQYGGKMRWALPPVWNGDLDTWIISARDGGGNVVHSYFYTYNAEKEIWVYNDYQGQFTRYFERNHKTTQFPDKRLPPPAGTTIPLAGDTAPSAVVIPPWAEQPTVLQKVINRSLVSTSVYANPYVKATVTYYPIGDTTFQVSEVRFSSQGVARGWIEFGIFPHESYFPPLLPLPGTSLWKKTFFTSGKDTVFTPNITVDRADVMALSFGGVAEGAVYFSAGPPTSLLKLTADLIKNAWPSITTFEPVAAPTLFPPTTSGSPQSLLKSQATDNPDPLLRIQGAGFSPNGRIDVVLLLPENTERTVQTLFSDDTGQLEIILDTLQLAPGTYQLWAINTFSGRQSNPVSFTLSSPSGKPDLTVTSVNAPLTAKVGETISVDYAVRNIGDATSESFENLVSLATSPWGTQIPLGYFSMESVGPDASRSGAAEVNIPSSVLPGRYWVTVYANPGEVGESRSDNNINKAASQIQVAAAGNTDATRPNVVLAGLTPGDTWIAGMEKTIEWTAYDNIGVTSVDLYFAPDGWASSQKVTSTGPNIKSCTWTVPQMSTSDAQFMIIAWDAAGNAGIDVTPKFTITIAQILPPAPTLNATVFNNSSYEVSWSSVPEADGYVLQEDSDPSFSNPTEYRVTQTSRYFGDRMPGTYYYRVAAVNEYGAGDWSATKSVTLHGDLGPGEITLITPSDNAAGQPLTLALQWSAAHPTGEKLTHDVFLMPFDSDTFYSAHIVSPGQPETTYTATNLEYNTTYSWGVRAWDETGDNRVSPVYHFTTVADQSPPSGAITINGEAETTDTYGVTLYLSASDTGSGVQYMRFSNDGQNWTQWEWFAPRYSWNIADSTYGGKPNQDVYTVYAQYRDMQGNESAIYSDTITKVKAKPGNIILNGVYYETIRDAVAAAQSGDIIYLTDGTYTIYGEPNPARYPGTSVGIVLKPGVTLKGAGADRTKLVAESGLRTIIDANNSVIEGLTIVMANPNGAIQAVLMESDSSAVRNSVIQSTGIGIEIWGNNNRVSNNLIKDSETGINVSLGTNSRIYNNTIVYNALAGVTSQSDTVAEMKNNIIAYNGEWGVYVSSAIDFRNNDVFGSWKNYEDSAPWLQNQTGVNGNMSVDPLLAYDYRLNSGSLAINAGIDVGIPFAGSAPDMGAFEYGATGTLQVASSSDNASFTIFGPQNYSGTGKTWSVSGAPIGVYSVTFAPISQHYTPPYETKALMSNQTLVFDGPYQIDTVPPSGTLTINFGEYATSDNIVTMTLSFMDEVAGMETGSLMMLSNDGVAWSQPEPFSTLRKGWDLTAYGGSSDSGLKTVYVKVSDVLENWTIESATDTILYVPNRQILEVPTEYHTIQAAIDAAPDGDMVFVLPGDYVENVVLKEGIRLQGSGTEVTSLTSVGSNPVITAAANSTIDGFTINKSPSTGNVGVLVQDASPIITNNVVRAFTGIQIRGNSMAVIRNNVIKDSQQFAISLGGASAAIIENNIIVGSNFDGIYLSDATPDTRIYVINNIIANNGLSGISDTDTSDTSHKHVYSSFNLFWQNGGGDFGGYNKDKILGAGDMNADPLFAGPSAGDFGLQVGSAAINSGHPEARYNDLDGTRNDRGSYGGPSLNTPPKPIFVSNVDIGGRGAVFTFDASAAFDCESPDEELWVRWDLDGDGVYDTGFQNIKQVDHRYNALGEYGVTLQVRDSGYFLSSAKKRVKVVNQSPYTPSNPVPAHNGVRQPLNLALSWTGGDPDPGDIVTYDVYSGASGNPPPLVSSNQTATTYNPGQLQFNTFYNWRIVSTDSSGLSVSSPAWSFLTELEPIPDSPSSLMAATISRSQIDLEWLDNSDNELGFKVERKIGADDAYNLIEILPSGSTHFGDSNLVQGTSYYYKVSAYNGTGDSAYSNEASAATMAVLTRSIVFRAGWNMFSVPLNPLDADFASVVGDDVSPLYVFWYNPDGGGYQMWSKEDKVFTADPGKGYWLKVAADTTVDIEGIAVADQSFTIHLKVGWNMIGQPFTYAVDWGGVMVYNPATAQTVTIEESHSRGWVSKYMYWYDTSVGGYKMETAPDGQLTPWYGYWVRSLVEADLIILPMPALWQILTAQEGRVFYETSLAFDATGKPHVAYGGNELYYAVKDGGGWRKEQIEPRGAGRYLSLALDSSKNPAISYEDMRNHDLKFVRWNGASWTKQTVDEDFQSDISLAFDPSGRPAIAYYGSKLKYAHFNGSSWETEVVDPSAWGYRGVSLDFDSSGNPAISFHDGKLKYARRIGAIWNIEVVDATGGQYSSLSFDPSGTPAIAYENNTFLKYARFNGSSWDTEVVDVDVFGQLGISLAIDPLLGNAAIGYIDYYGARLKYAYLAGNSWEIHKSQEGIYSPRSASFGFDPQGNPGLAFVDGPNEDIRFASFGRTRNLTQIVVPPGVLEPNDGYYWRARHQDSLGTWSSWSAETYFTTQNPPPPTSSSQYPPTGKRNISSLGGTHDPSPTASIASLPPNQPVNLSPANGASDVALTPTLVSSVFSDPDAEDAHLSSQWQIRRASTDNASLTETGVLSLNPATKYFWRVSFQDDKGDWSEWSTETSFVTKDFESMAYGTFKPEAAPRFVTPLSASSAGPNHPPDQPSNTYPPDGATLDTPHSVWLRSSDFSDPDPGDKHYDSHWQIRTASQDYQRRPSLDKYSVWQPVFDSAVYWQIETIDNGGPVGLLTSLDLNTQGIPGTTFYDSQDRSLRYGSWNGSSWTIEIVDSDFWVGGTSFAFDASDNPAIGYCDSAGIKFAWRNGASWSLQTIDESGGSCSLAFDSLGNPAISYNGDSVNSWDDLKLARFDGTAWSIQTIDSDGQIGWGSSLAFDNQGNPTISYLDATNGSVKYAYFNGMSWDIVLIDNGARSNTSLAFDIHGNPAISYVGANGVKYAHYNGGLWHIETVDGDRWAGDVSLSFDSRNNPTISYQMNHGWGSADLKYAHWDGASWNIEVVDSGNVGLYSSLAFDSWGNPIISYFDSGNGDLKVATKSPGMFWDG